MMKFKEILIFADEAVYQQTNKHLSDLQRDILIESLENHKYSQVAAKYDCSIEYIHQVAAQLWKYISDKLGEKVNKSNVRATFERMGLIISSSFNNFAHIQEINFCESGLQPPEINQKKQSLQPILDIDYTETSTNFYGREQELKTLQTWLDHKSKLIAIMGLPQIGKSYLTYQLITQNKDNFDYIIWRNIDDFADLENLEIDLINVFLKSQEQELKTKTRSLKQFLQDYKCLIVIDNVQNILQTQQLSGYYQSIYENYQKFWRQIATNNHQSCVIICSWEIPSDIKNLAEQSSNVHLLYLHGFKEPAKKIIQEQGLNDEEICQLLIDVYQGHPFWLKLVANMLKKLYSENEIKLLLNQQIFIPERIKTILDIQNQRLSSIEQQVILYLANNEQKFAVMEIAQNMGLSHQVVSNVIESLLDRSLIEQISNSEPKFSISPIIKEYYQNFNH
jgi:NB-ARC domain